MLELLKNTEVVIGVILSAFTFLSTLILWLDRRRKLLTSDAVSQATASSEDLRTKVSEVEHDLGDVARDVSAVKRDLTELSGRVHSVEKSMETVARQADLAKLNSEVKGLSGAVTAELRHLTNMMHSFHVSALRAAERKDNT